MSKLKVRATIPGLGYARGSLLPADSNVHFWRYRNERHEAQEPEEPHEKKSPFRHGCSKAAMLPVERD